jgi:outer membrane lipoprotein SlyB
MKFTAASLISIAALASTAIATSMTLSGCAIGHTSTGNQFTMQWNNVPSASQGSLCGHFADAVGAVAGQIIVRSITCSTDNSNNMDTIVKLDKTSCVNQANLIGQAISQALGSGGTLSYDSGRCNFDSSGC